MFARRATRDAHAGQGAYKAPRLAYGVGRRDLRRRSDRRVRGNEGGPAGTPGAGADEGSRTRGEGDAGERRERGGIAGGLDGENGRKENERCIGKITLILGLG
jgi:hypothetical protein